MNERKWCGDCKHEFIDRFSEPCVSCDHHSKWESKFNPEPKKLYTAADLKQAKADGQAKLRAFMTGLECENVDQFIGLASKEACLALGKLIRSKIEQVRADERARCNKIISAAKALIDKWDSHMIDGPEKLVKHPVGDYWSPVAVMLESSVVAGLREAIRALGPIGETHDHMMELWDAYESGYCRGHNDTVESCVVDSKESAHGYFEGRKIETREETERRVRRETIAAVKLMTAQKPNPDKNGCYITFETLDAIAEGK